MSAPIDPRERQLDAAARALPQDIAPPPELLARVQVAIGERRVRALPSAVAPTAAAPRPRWAMPRRLAAAAALLLVGALAGAGAVLLLQRDPAPGVAASGAPSTGTTPVVGASARSSAEFVAYDRAASDLALLLEQRRVTLRPGTAAVIERALAQIDTAMADVRAALARDPASRTLTDIMRRLYDQKLDLLKRSSALSIS